MIPKEASQKTNKGRIYFIKDKKARITPKFKPHDQVRISKHKRKFEKGYTPNWTEEIFVVDKVNMTNPVTYHLKDLKNEKILGSFYQQELARAKQTIFRIEKVIKRDNKKKMALVKWLGYSDEHNSWVPSGVLIKILINNIMEKN